MGRKWWVEKEKESWSHQRSLHALFHFNENFQKQAWNIGPPQKSSELPVPFWVEDMKKLDTFSSSSFFSKSKVDKKSNKL